MTEIKCPTCNRCYCKNKKWEPFIGKGIEANICQDCGTIHSIRDKTKESKRIIWIEEPGKPSRIISSEKVLDPRKEGERIADELLDSLKKELA